MGTRYLGACGFLGMCISLTLARERVPELVVAALVFHLGPRATFYAIFLLVGAKGSSYAKEIARGSHERRVSVLGKARGVRPRHAWHGIL